MSGLENARRLGEDLAVLATPRLKTLPFYFPEHRTTGSRYDNEAPRVYSLRDESGKLQRAYRIVISTGRAGRVLRRPGDDVAQPARLRPARTASVEINGRKLMLFYDGSKLRQIAWRTPRGALLRHQHARPRDLERPHAGDRVVIETTQ